MRPRRFDLIAFDWDGTLFDSTATIARCIQAAVRDVGGTVPTVENASFVIGMSLMEALAYAAPDVPPSRLPKLADRYRHHYFAIQHEITLFEGIVPLLTQLKMWGHRLAVATGKSRQGLDEALSTDELQALFDSSRTSDQTASKPNPLMLQELMAEFDVLPQRTLMIGDTTHDLHMALNAGCSSVAVSYGAHDQQALLDMNPLFMAHSVVQLGDWLKVNA